MSDAQTRPATQPVLSTADVEWIAELARAPNSAPRVFAAVQEIAARTIGFKLCGVMRLHPETVELERIHSNLPVDYPVGGRKQKRGLAWTEQVLVRGEIYLGATPDDLRRDFDDSDKLIGLGLGSILNTPIVVGGRCLGTFNLSHQAGWYRREDEAVTRTLAYLLAPVLMAERA